MPARTLGHLRSLLPVAVLLCLAAAVQAELPGSGTAAAPQPAVHDQPLDHWSMLFVFLLATFVGLGVVRRVSRLLYTPLMSLTNAISAIAVVGAIIVTGSDYPPATRLMGAVALFASMTNIVSGFLITNRMLKLFRPSEPAPGGRTTGAGSGA